MSCNLLKSKIRPCFIWQWNHENPPLARQTDTSHEDGFSVQSKIFPVNDRCQTIACVIYGFQKSGDNGL